VLRKVTKFGHVLQHTSKIVIYLMAHEQIAIVQANSDGSHGSNPAGVRITEDEKAVFWWAGTANISLKPNCDDKHLKAAANLN
jgi:hypothetical protein